MTLDQMVVVVLLAEQELTVLSLEQIQLMPPAAVEVAAHLQQTQMGT